jgi:hypothetical protein
MDHPIASFDRPRLMHTDPGVSRCAPGPHGHLGSTLVPLDEPPMCASRVVGEESGLPAGLHGGHPDRFRSKRAMPHRVDTAMHAVQAAVPRTVADCVPGQPALPQLGGGHDALVATRDHCDARVSAGRRDLVGYTALISRVATSWGVRALASTRDFVGYRALMWRVAACAGCHPAEPCAGLFARRAPHASRVCQAIAESVPRPIRDTAAL